MTALVRHVLDAPWGPVEILVSAAGVVALDTAGSGDDATRRYVDQGFGIAPPGTATREAAMLASRVRDAVQRYLEGDLAAIETLGDVRLAAVGARSPFDTRVFAAARGIPAGAVTSYGRLARRIGSPGAARAVGGAVARCEVGLIVPCHRVIAGDGTLGGYGGDPFGGRERALAVKRAMLEHEGVKVPIPPALLW